MACNFDNATYLSFYKNLKQATTLSIQYTCNAEVGLNPNSAVITSLNISQPSDYQCLYTCSYTEPTITCTRWRKDNHIVLSQTNLVPIVKLNNSNTWDSCVQTIWPDLSSLYVFDSSLVLNKSCVPLCDEDNYVNQTKTTQVNEGHITKTAQTLSTSLSTPLFPSTTVGFIAPSVKSSQVIQDTDTKNSLIVGVCLGIVIVILVGIIVFFIIRRKKHGRNVPKDNSTDTVDDQQIEISQISMPETGSYDTLGGYENQSNSGNLTTAGSYVNALEMKSQGNNQYEAVTNGFAQYKNVYE